MTTVAATKPHPIFLAGRWAESPWQTSLRSGRRRLGARITPLRLRSPHGAARIPDVASLGKD